jgi:hypothetical protein
MLKVLNDRKGDTKASTNIRKQAKKQFAKEKNKEVSFKNRDIENDRTIGDWPGYGTRSQCSTIQQHRANGVLESQSLSCSRSTKPRSKLRT